MLVHVVPEVFEQCDFFVERLWVDFECVVMLLTIPLNVVDVPRKQSIMLAL
jgi:hypothetical protein